MRLIAVLIPLIFSATVSAEVYKCTDPQGKTVFSDRPCGDDAETVDVKVHSSGISHGPQGDFQKVSDDIERRKLERKIDRLEDEIDAMEDARANKLAQLRAKKNQANNNLAGATWEQSIATEMRAITDDFNARIERRQAEVDRTQSQLNALNDSN